MITTEKAAKNFLRPNFNEKLYWIILINQNEPNFMHLWSCSNDKSINLLLGNDFLRARSQACIEIIHTIQCHNELVK